MELIDVTARYQDRFPGGGRVLQCSECGTLLRPGQPHSALKPTPHQSIGALIVIEPEEVTRALDGSHGEIYEDDGDGRSTAGRLVTLEYRDAHGWK